MSTATINLNFRPIKVAHLIDPQNEQALISAIHANTLLWGGSFNPIIPNIKRAGREWNIFRNVKFTSRQIVENYINNFDPDIIVSNEQESTKPFNVDIVRPIVNFQDFWQPATKELQLGAGISLFEIADHFADTEFKYIRKNPISIDLPRYKGDFSVFFSSVFGEFPKDLMDIFIKRYSNDLPIKQVDCDISNFTNLLNRNNIFLRRMTSLNLRATRNAPREDCGMLLDAMNFLDIIDYMNLRALGWTVIPIPLQGYESQQTVDFFLKFIDENYLPPIGGRGPSRTTGLIKGRSISTDNFKKVVSFFSSKLNQKPGEYPKLTFAEWYPYVWDNKIGEHSESTLPNLSYKMEKVDFEELKETTSIHLPKIDFSWSYWASGPRYATDISFRTYGESELFAEVIPEAPRILAKAFSFLELDEWRFSRKGIVYLTKHDDRTVPIKFPKAQDIFLQYLVSKGWKAKISTPGKIAYQMLKYLKGIWGVTIFTNEDILKLLTQPVVLEGMSKDKANEMKSRASRGLTLGEIRGVLQQVVEKGKRPFHPAFHSNINNIISRLVDSSVIALGLKIQCPTCSKHSWYSLSEIDYSLKCPECYCNFILPTYDTKALGWSYKTIGPFSLPESAYGVYSVLLTLRFFSMTLDFATTPILSFCAEKTGAKPLEADLGLLFKNSRFSDDSKIPRVLFVECKTYNGFAQKDVARMEVIAKEFPQAILVFATLRRKLESKEKKMIRKIAEKGRKLNSQYKQRNPVLILTGTELFDTYWPPEEWKTMGDKFLNFANIRSGHDIDTLCDINQQLYLDMDSFSDWYEKRRKNKIEKQIEISPQLLDGSNKT